MAKIKVTFNLSPRTYVAGMRTRTASQRQKAKSLQDLRKSYSGKPFDYGGIAIEQGHDYWWFLEYGAAGRKENKIFPGSKIRLKRPISIKPFDLPKGWYEIEAHLRADGKLAGKQGWLRYRPRGAAVKTGSGGYVFKKFTQHEGQRGTGMFRMAVHEMRRNIASDLKKLMKNNPLPLRSDFVELVNNNIIKVRNHLQSVLPRTPEDEMSDLAEYHGRISGAERPTRRSLSHLAEGIEAILLKE